MSAQRHDLPPIEANAVFQAPSAGPSAEWSENSAKLHALPLPGAFDRAPQVLGTTVPVETFDDQLPPPRHRDVEAVWFALCDNGFQTTTIVAVPPLTGDIAHAFACDLARTAGAIVKNDVHVISTLGVPPDQAVQAVAELPTLGNAPVLVVTDAPTVNTSGLPVLRSAKRILLVVGRGHSEVSEAEQLVEHIGVDRIVGSVVIASAPGRRRSRFRRRRS